MFQDLRTSVRMAMSSSMAFRRSPKPAAFTAATLSNESSGAELLVMGKGGLASCSGIGPGRGTCWHRHLATCWCRHPENTTQSPQSWTRTAGCSEHLVEEDERPRNEAIGQASGPIVAIHSSVGVVWADAPADSSSRGARAASIERGRSPSNATLSQ